MRPRAYYPLTFLHSEAVDPKGGQPKDDRVSMEHVRQKARLGLDMRVWAWVIFFAYALLFGAALLLVMLQDFAGVLDGHHRLRCALTQTAGLWTPVRDAADGGSLSGGFSFSGKCPAFGARTALSDSYVQPVTFSAGSFDARYVMLGVLASGAVFQLFTVFNEGLFYGPLRLGNNHVGSYLERMISIPLTVLTLCAQAGLTDLWVVVGAMAHAWGCAMFVFFSEVLFQGDGGALSFAVTLWMTDEPEEGVSGVRLWSEGVAHYHGIAVFGAWVLFAVMVATMQSNLSVVAECFLSPPALPWNMAAAIYAGMALVGLMLVCQTVSLMFKPKPAKARGNPESIARRVVFAIWVEYVFMLLDFVLKLMLFVCLFGVGALYAS